MGDLGTLLPLLIALTSNNSIYLPQALFFAGLVNFLTGLYVDIPMCVQPMKSIAAVAIAQSMTKEQVSCSGVLMGLIVIFINVTNLVEFINILIPKSVVYGMQLGVGLKLFISGMTYIKDLSWISSLDCVVTGLSTGVMTLYLMRAHNTSSISRLPPAAITIFTIAIVLACIQINMTNPPTPFTFSPSSPVIWAFHNTTNSDWSSSFFQLALPQLPLTTLNSIISVCALADNLYPELKTQRPHDSSPTVISRYEMGLSIGVFNLIGCLFGAMPICHGAGGLAAQHKFGARTGSSVIFLGTVKMIVAVFFGNFCIVVFEAIPKSVLGVMLAFAGAELGLVGVKFAGKEQMDEQDLFVLISTAGAIVGLGRTDVGTLVGWVAYLLYGNGVRDYKKYLEIDTDISGLEEKESKVCNVS